MDAVYVVACCYVLYCIAQRWWTEREALVAACLLAFFLAFYLPSAVIPFAADAVMLLPHLLAIYCATCRRPFLAGLFAGIGFLANIKALFVLAVCGLWLLPETVWVVVGFVLPIAIGYVPLFALGAWPGYVEQVWRWGLMYAAGSPVAHPLSNGVLRPLNWLGFHAALALGAGYELLRRGEKHKARASVWITFSFAAVALGSRFAP